jgi:benzoate/toluate 1,2-dioxygenase alpha subunit
MAAAIAALADSISIGGLVLEDRTHRSIYTDPQLFDLEMARIFAGSWAYLGHESEVASPGDYTTSTIGRQPVLLTRDEHGELRALYNRCRHRGALVCREERGNSKYFRCLYHGWTYNNGGDLIGVPHRPGYGDDFNTDELGLVPVPRMATYRGFVFICFKPDVEPLEAFLGRAGQYIDVLADESPTGEIEVAKNVQKHTYRGNWKLILENFVDNYHPSFTHEATMARRAARSAMRQADRVDDESEIGDLGHGHAIIDWPPTTPYRSGLNIAVFPNPLLCTAHRDIRVIRPIAVDRTEIWAYHYRLKGDVGDKNGRAVRTTTNAVGAAGTIQPDDCEAFERAQEGLQAEGVDWVLFNRGMHRERVMPNGELRSVGGDELGIRGQHREYRRLLLRADRSCCRGDGVCLGPRAEMDATTA